MKKRKEFKKNLILNKAIKLINSKWSLLIIKELCHNKILRFTELKVNLKINTKTLTKELRRLDNLGIIKRKVYPETPLRVEYKLTQKGKEFKKILLNIQNWYLKWFFKKKINLNKN